LSQQLRTNSITAVGKVQPMPTVDDVNANATAGNGDEDNSDKMVAMTMPMTG